MHPYIPGRRGSLSSQWHGEHSPVSHPTVVRLGVCHGAAAGMAYGAPMGHVSMPPQGAGGAGAGRPPSAVGRQLFVSNLDFEVTWQNLKDHFKGFDVQVRALDQGDARDQGKRVTLLRRGEDADGAGI